MKTFKKAARQFAAKALLIMGLVFFSVTYAAPVFACTDNSGGDCGGPSGNTTSQTTATNPNCSNSSDPGIQKCIATNPIVKDLNLVVDFLSTGVGIVVIGSIIVGGIQYTLAGDNATATAAAKKRITDALIALVAFLFTFAFLQWIIPGGL